MMKHAVVPEYKLLLYCARTILGEEHISAIATVLEKPLAWRSVLELASWHRLSALLFLNLRRREFADFIPGPVIHDLRKVYHGNAARNLYLQAELRQVLQALQAGGIPAIVLKGGALAEIVYQDIALRPMSDLDLLVPEHDLDRADNLVQALGYHTSASPGVLKRTRKEHRHYPGLYSQDNLVKFEIHRHIIREDNPLHFDLTGFWARAHHQVLAGSPALIPAPEDLLLHLCINFFLDRHNHSNGALGQVVDISESIRYYAAVLDWDLLVSNARQYRLAGPTYCALLITGELLGTLPPEEVLRDLKPEAFSPTMARLFIDRRVLSTRPWLAHQLVNARQQYTAFNLAWSAFRRVFSNNSSLAEKYGQSGSQRSAFGLRARRLMEVSQSLGKFLLRPRELRQDLQLDQWLHSLHHR